MNCLSVKCVIKKEHTKISYTQSLYKLEVTGEGEASTSDLTLTEEGKHRQTVTSRYQFIPILAGLFYKRAHSRVKHQEVR